MQIHALRNTSGRAFQFGGIRSKLLAILAILAVGPGLLHASTVVNFELLTWNDAQATVPLPSAVGRKPSDVHPATSDWLVFTGGDVNPGAGFNPHGAVSHNFADMSGVGGSSFNNAPSLSGSLTLGFTASGPTSWDVSVDSMAYAGQATSMMFMNQYLVKPGDPATLNPSFNVDGLGNSGTWSASNAAQWAIQYNTDFYFATNADGDPSPTDVDATFNNKLQTGFLLPVSLLNGIDLPPLGLDDPAGFFSGNFGDYLVNEIAPRLPANATYLLITQMAKTNPDYAEIGLPITTSSLIGNTTFAFTTSAIPEPSSLWLLTVAGAWLLRTKIRRAS